MFFTSGAKLVAPPQPELRTKRMVATAENIWVESGGRVSRVPMADLESGSFKEQTYPQWRKVVVGDPRADRVVVIDDRGCQAVLNGSNAALVWRTCDWKLSTFSADGRFGAGRSVRYGTIGVIELSTAQLVLGIDPDLNALGPQMVFDEGGRLNFRLGDPAQRFAAMVSDLAAECWFSSTRYADPIEFVLPNRK